MPDRGLIHYQPLTGPVWREPVAAALAWLPRGEPARPLERRVPSEFVYPPFYELYNPAGLHWLPSGRWPLYPEVRKLGDFQQPPFDALYKSEQLGWLSSAAYLGRTLPRGALDLTVFPVQFASPAFDPQNLEWIPKGPPPRTLVEVRKLGDFVQPPFDALYKSEGLQWTPKGIYPQLPVERRILGDFAQPAFDALYKPEGLQWLFEGQLSVRGIPYPLASSWIIDPAPVVTVTFDPQFFPFQVTDILLARTLRAALQSDFSTPPLPPGPDVVVVIPSVGGGASGKRYRQPPWWGDEKKRKLQKKVEAVQKQIEKKRQQVDFAPDLYRMERLIEQLQELQKRLMKLLEQIDEINKQAGEEEVAVIYAIYRSLH